MTLPLDSLGRLYSVGEVTVLACAGHVFERRGFRRQRCVHCGLVAVLRWWSWWDETVVSLHVGSEQLWPPTVPERDYMSDTRTMHDALMWMAGGRVSAGNGDSPVVANYQLSRIANALEAINGNAPPPRGLVMAVEVPVRSYGGGAWKDVALHELSDDELQTFAASFSARTGWLWARALARRLAGVARLNDDGPLVVQPVSAPEKT